MISDPKMILDQVAIKRGDSVADLGAGQGFFALEVTHRVGHEGHVYAVDLNEPLLKRLAAQAEREGLNNLDIVPSNIAGVRGSRLRDNSIDVVLLINVLFQALDPGRILAEAYRIAKMGGSIVVVDWEEGGTIGPKTDHRIDKKMTTELMERLGLHNPREIEAGVHHYGLIVKK